ncbi:uncharacterized protein LOC129574815 isoform X2 [Sitodiplosis mosellana]|uniref:uncharacterized protein LOC129574815 isoform X2 n=1 Tax=Sitodiplosis mosellana TaxID=263140 RepID=UPI002444BF73|nr:uncharacterized protein LOC129574815 isoform X2 [Sitodiplosis mosellana]
MTVLISIIISVIWCCDRIGADVSHLKSTNHNHFQSFNGYNYNPPLHQLPSPAPSPPITTTFRPEIIVNKEPSNVYLPPPTPSTETSIVIHPPDDLEGVYLPPFHEEIPPPQTEPPQNYLPPEPEPDYQYLPPPPADEINEGYQYSRPKQPKYLRNSNVLLNSKPGALHISVNNLRCLEGNGGYFQANIVVQSFIENLPIIDSDTIDSRCQFHLVGVQLILNIAYIDFQRCGIAPCGSRELCVNLRFPQIFGMKALDDNLLTLKCKIQERVISKTHAFRFGVSHSGQARNAVVFAHGGGKQSLRTQLGLYRQSGSGFTKNLDAGGFVQLGEELMLRAQVKAGDGWNHTRVSDVTLQRLGSNGEVLNSATLIKSNGCINPQMNSVCSLPPVFEPPLGYRFGFRAVMFQGMKSGDEMIMTVRVLGCMDHHDCHLDPINCADHQTTNRVRRQAERDKNADKTLEPLVDVSNISFRVVMPSDRQTIKSFSHETVNNSNNKGEIAFFVTVAVVSFLIVIVLIIIKQRVHRQFFVWDKY